MNSKVQQAWEVGLNLLDPSSKEMQRGLELHRTSLVVDGYAFAPRSGVDVEELARITQAGASADEFEELYCEMFMLGMIVDQEAKRYFAEAFETAGVTCIFQNAGEESNDIETLLRRLGRFTHATDAMPDVLARVTHPDHILRAFEEKKRCLYLTTNGVPVPCNFRTATEGLNYIRTFFQLGVRMMHLTYNRRNLIGDGCAEPNDGGLSEFGRDVVREMNRVGVIVDIAHSGIRTGLDAARHSEKPVAISHATCRSLAEHIRAKTDELIRAVANTGGLIGICCIPGFLQRTGDINAFLDHIDYAVKLVGADHVSIATDRSAYTAQDQPLPFRPKSRPRFESLWAPDDALHQPEWNQDHMQQSLAWTNWPLFTVGLVKRGYSDEDIQKILGLNVLRVARDVLG